MYAPFSGTVDEVLVDEDGVIIAKGQALLKVTPDEKIEQVSEEELAQRRREHTDALLQPLL